jgi:hypothetical protein
MITVPGLAAEALGSLLSSDMNRRFGSSHARLTELVPSAARLALECIGNSDALYHTAPRTCWPEAGHLCRDGNLVWVPSDKATA